MFAPDCKGGVKGGNIIPFPSGSGRKYSSSQHNKTVGAVIVLQKAAIKRNSVSIVYQLKEDQQRIQQVQRATRTTKNFGIEPTHGIFGSDEWWQNIESGRLGRLALHTLKGKITKVCMSGMGPTGDWPEFIMVSDTGEESSWTRMKHFAEQDQLYRVGAPIEIDFVWQQHRPKSFAHGAEVKQVLEVRIVDSNAP